MLKIIFITLIVLFVSSCTKDISINIANTSSKIVVNSFFAPQDSLLINISKTISILATDTLNYVNNASVELFNGASSIGKLTYIQNGFYTLPTKLMPQGGYSVKVSVPDMDTVTSQDTIPVTVPILSIDTVTLNNTNLYCEIKFQDNAKTSNYYLLDVTSKYPVQNDTILSKQVKIIVSNNIVEDGSIGDTCQRIFFSNEKIKNKLFQLSFILNKETILRSLKNNSNTLYINFKTISQNYYKYLTTYYLSQTSQMDIYSNIVNGYGIFAGYNLSQDSIVIKR